MPASLRRGTAVMRSQTAKSIAASLCVILLPGALLLWNVHSHLSGSTFRQFSGDWARAWDDVALAVGFAEYGEFPVAPYLVTNGFSRKGQVAFDEFKATVEQLGAAHQTSLVRPWVGFPAQDLFPRRPRVAQRFDDWGRSYFLGWAFRALGKVSAGMLFWMGPLFAACALTWIMAECLRARLAMLGLVTCLLTALSAFAVDVLTLGYSAAGFYLVSLLVTLAFAIGVLGGALAAPGLFMRSLLGGALLAVAVGARSVSLIALPFVLLVAVVGALHLPRPRGHRFVAFVVAAGLLVAPTFLLRMHIDASARQAAERFGGDVVPASHDIWITYWQGLGDFDRTHGHTFLDQAGLTAVRARGGKERVSERSEEIMRGLVLDSIRSEPGWFAAILMKRAFSTLSFRKLWPMASNEGPGIRASDSENEGVTDSYWTMTAQADTFRIGSTALEVPAILYPAIVLAFAVTAIAAVARRRQRGQRLGVPVVSIILLILAAALVAPVVTTTAGAFEPQSFAVAVFAALGGLVELVRLERRDASPASAGDLR